MELITDLRYLVRMLLRRFWVIMSLTTLVVGGTAFYTFTQRPVYEASALLLIEKEGENTLTQEGVKVESLQDDYYQTQYELLQSRNLAERVVERLKIRQHPEFVSEPDPAEALRSRIRIVPVRRSRLVRIAVKAFDPGLSASLANAIASEFAVQNMEGRSFLARGVLQALEERDSSLSVESLPAVVNSPLIQELKTNLTKLKSENAQLSRRYQARHPRMLQLYAQIMETQDQLQREIRHIAQSVKIQLSGQLQGNNVRLVDPARVPESPVRPRKARDLAMAFVFSLIVGFGMAFLIDKLDSTLHTREELEKRVKIPYLGSIPKLRGLGRHPGFERIWTDNPLRDEWFRNLKTAISIRLPPMKDSTTVMVTSSIPREGRSLLCAYLARSFAQSGERVLLIDGDLRHPIQHRFFGFEMVQGLSTHLAAGDNPATYLLNTHVPNLMLLPAGPIEDNPADLLSDARLRDLIQWASGEFDRIILDSSPLIPVADALLWRKYVHGVVFMARLHHVSTTAAQRACQILKEGFGHVLGVVFNHDVASPFTTYSYTRHASQRDMPSRRAPLANRPGV